ncbi:hypothetical protein BH10CHL1_BH10CHL1_47230 [soil metagenome]
MQSGLLDLNTITNLLELNDPTEPNTFFAELVKEFFIQAAQLISIIKQLIDQHNSLELVSHLHSLKGASLNMGALALAAACETIEIALENNRLSEMNSWPAKLELIYQETVQAMEQIKNTI